MRFDSDGDGACDGGDDQDGDDDDDNDDRTASHCLPANITSVVRVSLGL